MSVLIDIEGTIGTLPIRAQFEGGAGVSALYGPSGAGKSTVLRAVAGLWTPSAGRIEVRERVLFDSGAGVDVPVHLRRLGVVFQNPSLFPHLDVRRNLAYGGDGSGLDRVVALLGLEQLLARMPRNLSGGEAQRVAIGRALLANPSMLLLDEPLTGLDDVRRAEVLGHLVRVRDAMNLPILYVSHHRDEIGALADLVFVMEAGRVVRELAPTQLTAALAQGSTP